MVLQHLLEEKIYQLPGEKGDMSSHSIDVSCI